MKKYFVEFVGTLFLILIIGLTSNPVAIGFGLTVLVYMGAHISGAHYNPVVSLAFIIKKDINRKDFIFYVLSQITGATIGALLIYFLKDSVVEIQPNLSSSIYQILISEILFTFLLVFVILNVATHPNLEDNSFYGFAIGLTVMAGAFSVGPISGAVFNPAVSLGPTLSHLIIGDGISKYYLWYFLLGPTIGGVIGTFAFLYLVKK